MEIKFHTNIGENYESYEFYKYGKRYAD
jgi:hypothetical protein